MMDETMSQYCGMEPSHSPLQGPMLVSHYEILNTSLAEMQAVDRLPVDKGRRPT
jgi:hypothetical protein